MYIWGPYHVNIVDGCPNICVYYFEEEFIFRKCSWVQEKRVLVMHRAHIHIQKLFLVAINYQQCVHMLLLLLCSYCSCFVSQEEHT